jgi:hypothetical protein
MITIQQMKDIIKSAYLKNPKQNLGFLGVPGLGKTDGIHQVAEELKEIYPDFFVDTHIISQMAPEDFGVPWIENGDYKTKVHSSFIFKPEARGFIFFDEAANGTDDTKKAVQNIFSSRMLYGHKIPDGVMLLIASNNMEDRAGAGSFNTAFGNRVEWHEVEKDFKGWYYWAINHGIDFSITSFLKKFPNLLFDFKTDRKINATGRTWAKANDVLGDSNEFPRLSGLVGEGIATQFCAYKEVFMEFPEINDVEQHPEKAKVPKNKDAQYAFVYALIQHLKPKNWAAFVQYCGRMNKEYLTLFVTEALEHYPKQGYNKTPEYTKFIYENQKDLL